MSLALPSPLLVWALALTCLGAALRARRAPATTGAAPPRLPAPLRLAAALPLPAGLRRLGGRPGSSERLWSAGLGPSVPVATVERARLGAAALGATLAATSLVALPPPLALLLVPVLTLGGFMAPDRWLRRLARARRAALVRELPDLLDLLGICVESGMALDPALHVAATWLPGEVAAELRTTLRELALGTPRRAAYRALAARTGAPELGQVVAALLQAEELGAPLVTVLAGQAETLRATRRQAARDAAARAAPKIQLVVALLMVPAAMLLVLGVLVVELARQIGAVVGGA